MIPLGYNFCIAMYRHAIHLCSTLCFQGKRCRWLLPAGHLLHECLIPTAADLKSTFPASWTESSPGNPPPSQAWLDKFWSAVAVAKWTQLPKPFSDVKLVPLIGGCITTAAHCSTQPALTSSHLEVYEGEQEDVAKLLSHMGCLCISEPRADIVSNISADQEPITLALAAAASSKGISIQQLISEQRLSTEQFSLLCDLLASLELDLPAHHACRERVRAFLRQCTVHEDLNGNMLDLARQPDIRLLPSEAWEDIMPAVQACSPGP